MPEAIPSDQAWSYITAMLSGYFQTLPVHQTTRHGPSAVISWCDPTACCYWDQIWRRCRARKRGFFALTGAQIVAGDDVFRPRRASPAPRNIDAMILASVMEAMPLGELV
jgi:hypothetical protein